MSNIKIYNSSIRYSQRYANRLNKITNEDQEFIKWINAVENIVLSEIGFGLLELSDMTYYDSFEKKVSPKTMAQCVINHNKIFI